MIYAAGAQSSYGVWTARGPIREGLKGGYRMLRGQVVDLQVVDARQGRYAWASAAQFLPHNSAATHFNIAASMQLNRELKTEQIGTRTVLVGALGRVGGGGSGGSSSKFSCAFHKNFYHPPVCGVI
eukprot:1158762-Pelagomonas_calceolata.AAC.8